MPATRLVLAALLATSTAYAQVADPVAITAARMKAFPVAQSVERADAYTPAETVKGRPRPLPVATASGIDAKARLDAQSYAEAQNSFAFIALRDGKIAHE